MAHCIVPEAEAILDKEFKVLNFGFVRMVDYMGSDDRVVQAARVSYGAGTKTKREDKGLINYLMRNAHTSPFEMPHILFHVKMPIFVARQWVRHRTCNMNEYSARYSEMPDQFYVPEPDRVQGQDNKNKQSSGTVLTGLGQRAFQGLVKNSNRDSYCDYQAALHLGVSRELARIVLPVSNYTEMYWQMDLHNLLHFLKLRVDEHAQWEIQEYGRTLAGCVKAVCPVVYAAWEEHVLNAHTLSATEWIEYSKWKHGQTNLSVHSAAQDR